MASFLKQTSEPLFPKILWNRPISRTTAGRLLLVGGHKDGFSDVQALHQLSLAAGIGEARVVLPDSLAKLLFDAPDTIFVPSNPSGSLGKGALGEILHLAADYDAVVLGAELSNNSQTAILVESLLIKLKQPVILLGDALPAIKHNYRLATHNPDRLLILSMQQLFKLAGGLGIGLSIKPETDVIKKVEIVRQVADQVQADILLSGRDMIVASDEQISLTTSVSSMDFLAPTIAAASAFWTQNPANRFAGLTTAAWILRQARQVLSNGPEAALTTTEIAKAIQKVIRD